MFRGKKVCLPTCSFLAAARRLRRPPRSPSSPAFLADAQDSLCNGFRTPAVRTYQRTLGLWPTSASRQGTKARGLGTRWSGRYVGSAGTAQASRKVGRSARVGLELGLMVYATDFPDLSPLLKGTSPGEIPIFQATKPEFGNCSPLSHLCHGPGAFAGCLYARESRRDSSSGCHPRGSIRSTPTARRGWCCRC